MKTFVKNWLAEFNYELRESILVQVCNVMEDARSRGANKSAASRTVWSAVRDALGLRVIAEDGTQDAETKKILLGVTRIANYHSSESNMRNCFNAWAQPERYGSQGLRNGNGTRTRRNVTQNTPNTPNTPNATTQAATPAETEDERLRAAWEMFRASVAPLMAKEERNNLPYTFGVEIECGSDETTKEVLRDTLTSLGVRVKGANYHHEDSQNTWQITPDCSIRGHRYMYEIVSPVLKGGDGTAIERSVKSSIHRKP